MLKILSRSFRTAAWLGWQIESNWTSPLLFFAFSVLKPIASVLILVFMYKTVASVSTDAAIYGYIYVGNAFYIYVGAVMAGVSFSVLDDRERYRTLKYLYIAPISVPSYLFGRAAARFIIGTLAVLITMVAGALFFHVPIHLSQIDWPIFLPAFALGILCLAFMGVILGAYTLTIRSEPWFIGEVLAAALYLFSGAVFPITLLPRVLWPVGFTLPMAYWLELLRRSLLGARAAVLPPFAGLSSAALLGLLLGITALFGGLAALAYRRYDRIARERGLIDIQTSF